MTIVQARACRMDPNDTAAHMYLNLGCSNTPIVLGLGMGYALWHRAGLQERLDASTAWEKVALCVVGYAIRGILGPNCDGRRK
jgi:hypothetical protein